MNVKIDFRPIQQAEIEAELQVFEARYSVPSSRLLEAFTDADGRLRETDDFQRWSSLYEAWTLLSER